MQSCDLPEQDADHAPERAREQGSQTLPFMIIHASSLSHDIIAVRRACSQPTCTPLGPLLRIFSRSCTAVDRMVGTEQSRIAYINGCSWVLLRAW